MILKYFLSNMFYTYRTQSLGIFFFIFYSNELYG